MRQAQARQDVSSAEIQHQTRNLIAVLRALAEKTLDGATTLAAFEDRFSALGGVRRLLSHASARREVTKLCEALDVTTDVLDD